MKYTKSFFFILYLFLGANSSMDMLAQIEVSVSANVNHMFPETSRQYSSSISTSVQHLEDSLWLARRVESFIGFKSTYTNIGGMTFKLGLTRPIHKNVTINSGLGIVYSSFKVNDEVSRHTFILNESVFSAAPPAPPAPPTPSPPNFSFFESPCDSYSNSWEDVELDSDHQRNTYSIMIPLEIEYYLSDIGFSGSLGLYFETPFIAQLKNDRRDTRKVLEGSEVVCTYYREVYKNNTGRSVRNIKLGTSAFLQYTFRSGLAINLGYLMDLTDFYDDSGYLSSSILRSDSNLLKMRRASLGLRYFFANRNDEMYEIPFQSEE